MEVGAKINISILIRVYDRIEDLKYNLQIIRQTWKHFNYYIIVVSNGKSKGYDIPKESELLIDKLVVLNENAGHRKGNSQLLIEGIKYIPHDSDFTLILEADTWIYTDKLLLKYTELMKKNNDIVWASADWYDKYHALATDFAIIKSQFIRETPDLFNFDLFPECHVCNSIVSAHKNYIWITEFMPVHIPSYIRGWFPYVPNIKEKRFYVFPKAQAVTHHIEWLQKGIDEKQKYFNVISEIQFFPVKTSFSKMKRLNMIFWIFFSNFLIKKSWFLKKQYKTIIEE